MADDTIAERWLPVKGYEGLYEVSDLGRVRSLHGAKQRVLRHHASRHGYRRLSLCCNGTEKHALVHRLVLIAFHGDPPPGHEGSHLNSVNTDNRASNLAWMTHRQNEDIRMERGLAMGENHVFAKLTEEAVREIRVSKESDRALSKKYGVNKSRIRDARTGETWRRVK